MILLIRGTFHLHHCIYLFYKSKEELAMGLIIKANVLHTVNVDILDYIQVKLTSLFFVNVDLKLSCKSIIPFRSQ